MSSHPSAPVPRSHWIISTLLLLWMLVGAGAWVADYLLDAEALARMTEGQRYLYEARPAWVFVVYGVAVFAGLAGAVGLLMRRSWAVPAFALSLVAVLVQFAYTLFVMDAIGRLGAATAIPFPVMIVAFGVTALVYARYASRRGWLVGGSGATMGAEPAV